MEKDILISIVVPIYNVEKYLVDCIESILAQNYRNFELILVDDGSSDHCGEICDAYEERDPRIKVIHKKNGGLSDARNAGIEIATGDYIGFVDSDDYIESDMYEKLLNACLESHSDISMCGRYVVTEDKKVVFEKFVLDGWMKYDSKTAIGKLLLWDSCDSAAWDKLYKRTLFDNVRYPLGVMSEDYDVTSRLFEKANGIVHIGEPKYHYVQRAESITKQGFTKKRFEVIYQVYQLVDFVSAIYPDLQNQTHYFTGKHLISMERFSLQSQDKDSVPEMKLLLKECKKNIYNICACQYLTFWEKLKFCVRLVLLNGHIRRLSDLEIKK